MQSDYKNDAIQIIYFMRKLVFSILMACCLQNTVLCQWRIINENKIYGSYSPAVDYLNEGTFMVASRNRIDKTEDNGKNWTSFVPFNDIYGEEGRILDMDFVDSLNGWAIYNSFGVNSVSISNDGGHSWVGTFEIGAETKLYALNEDTAFIFDDQWICLISKLNGWNDPTQISGPGFGKIADLQYLGNSRELFVAAGDSGKYGLFRLAYPSSFDWDTVVISDYPIHSFHFFDSQSVIALMEDSAGINIMKSNDSGLTWKRISDIRLYPRFTYYELLFGTENKMCIQLGSSPPELNILKTTNGGFSWSNAIFYYPSFTDVFQERDGNVYVTGLSGIGIDHHFRGDVFITSNWGNTWNRVFGILSAGVSFNFNNAGSNFIFTNNTIFQKTERVNGWFENDWRPDSTTSNQIKDLFFTDLSHGFLATGNSMFKTDNSGISWFKILQCDSCNINSIYFSSDSTGFAVGDAGVIINYNGSGLWIAKESNTSLPLKKVVFSDARSGLITGGYKDGGTIRSIILHTNDGGNTWKEMSGINFLVHDLSFQDTMHAWAVGEDSLGKGVILESLDGGKNWSVAMDSLSGPLYAVHYRDSIGWAVGENGLIISTIGSTYVNPIDTSNTGSYEKLVEIDIPQFEFSNYPNPFSFETTISYELSQKNDIELSVYDLSGRKVCTLFNGLKEAGRHQYTWNATGMKSGIYFCELKSANFRQVQKMILLK
jgi:photosystem II stability/assembly factor-like uncharacterized protein